ncbi:hypothetical protein PENTCL1PPCAC_23947, partial [Pristionchus entomophagus]
YKDDCVFIYIQMELCKQTLHDWLYSNDERDWNRSKTWFKQLVSAVAYLHEKKKIHRDLKPLNILLDERDRLKICDLGLVADRAMKNGQEIDRMRSIAGSPMYMAPEQEMRPGQLRSPYTSKVDVFSLGLILSELSVCMTVHKAIEVFENYRRGRANSILRNRPDMDEFVNWLTNVDAHNRPTCDAILADEFLS